MTYRNNKQPKTFKRHLLEVIVIGSIIGVPLAISAYIYLYVQGQKILAQDYANQIESIYREN